MTEIITFGSGIEFNVYASRETAETYALGTFGNAEWEAASNNQKERALISATRQFEAVKWCGSKTSASQALAWPRTGLTDREGNTLASDTIPEAVINGNIELAFSIVSETFAANQATAAGNIKRLKADEAEIEYFRALSTAATALFPKTVLDWVGLWICGSGSSGALSYGTDGESAYETGYTFNEGF